MPQLPEPFCMRCGIHLAPDQRCVPVRAWFRRRKQR